MAMALVAFYRAVFPAREGALPLVKGKIDDFLI
jgi:hypothetical protein